MATRRRKDGKLEYVNKNQEYLKKYQEYFKKDTDFRFDIWGFDDHEGSCSSSSCSRTNPVDCPACRKNIPKEEFIKQDEMEI